MNITSIQPNPSFSGTILKPTSVKPKVRQRLWAALYRDFRPVRVGRTYDIPTKTDKVVWATGPDAAKLRMKLREVTDLENYRETLKVSDSKTKKQQLADLNDSIERLKNAFLDEKRKLLKQAREDIVRTHFRLY